MIEIHTQLRKFDLFKNASEQEINDISHGCSFKSFSKDSIILCEGDSVNYVYFIAQGHLQVFLSNKNGKEIILKDLYDGDSFGELGVLSTSRRCASIVTKSDVDLIALNESSYRNYYQNNLSAARSVIHILASSLTRLTRDYESLALDDLNHRLIRVLLTISDRREGVLIVKHTHSEIANRVSSTRESVSRAISSMKNKQLVETDGNYIRLTEKLLDLYSQL